jgi:hypothetical protein
MRKDFYKREQEKSTEPQQEVVREDREEWEAFVTG